MIYDQKMSFYALTEHYKLCVSKSSASCTVQRSPYTIDYILCGS